MGLMDKLKAAGKEYDKWKTSSEKATLKNREKRIKSLRSEKRMLREEVAVSRLKKRLRDSEGGGGLGDLNLLGSPYKATRSSSRSEPEIFSFGSPSSPRRKRGRDAPLLGW